MARAHLTFGTEASKATEASTLFQRAQFRVDSVVQLTLQFYRDSCNCSERSHRLLTFITLLRAYEWRIELNRIQLFSIYIKYRNDRV